MSGTRATLRNTGTPLYAGDTLQPLPAGAPDTYVGGFSSYHTGAVNVLLADGTTRALETTIDPQFLQRLGNRADGSLLDWTTGH
ncbi:MAG: DUF1559 domain-containing protein [Planctomycetia bacterium]|nr:DUF1559 domain-containing protein [Planctomycetia bacterium]